MPNMARFDPHNPAPVILYSTHQLKEELANDVEQLYNQLEKNQNEWFLEELLQINCSKTTEIKKIIACLDLIHQENEDEIVALSKNQKINPKLITKKVLKECSKVQRQE